MEITRFEFNLFGENTYVIWDKASSDAAIIDPGMSDEKETKMILDFIEKDSLRLKYILLTHAHIDHTFGVDALKRHYPEVLIFSHKGDSLLALTRAQQAQMFHIPNKLSALEIDHYVDASTVLSLGTEQIKVIPTPGHSPGGVCYYIPYSEVLFSGDTLFSGSVGRVDLPGGNGRLLINSIKEQLLTLPPETIVLPGHGGATTIAKEKASNPYLR